jgi:hypothetical protein
MPPDRGLGRRFSWANAATSLDDPTPVQKRWRGREFACAASYST